MMKLKLGFVPAHREPFDEKWASQMRRRCLDVLAKIPQLEMVVPGEDLTRGGLVWDDNDAEKTIRFFREKEIDGLLLGTMTFGDEVAALAVASAFRDLPVFLFGTKEGAITRGGGRRSDSFCGTLSISSGLHRRHIPFIFGGVVFPEETEFTAGVVDFMQACSIVRGFIGARIGLVGPRPERFETCIFSEDALIEQFNQRVVNTSLPDIMSRAQKPDEKDPAIRKILRDMKSEADLSALKKDTVLDIVRLDYALREFAQEKHLAAMGIQCWTAMQSVYGISPCYVMSRLTDSGIMTSCEVDIYGALTMLVQYRATLETTPPHFIDWTIQHQKEENVFLAWHCGNGPPSLVCKNSKVNISYHSILGESLGLERSMGTAEFQLRPGLVTLCRLQEMDGIFKMLITTGEGIESSQHLRGSWLWVRVPDLQELYRTLVGEGFVHHASLIHGDYTRSIKQACDLMGIESVIL
jgi:L-fucose isomerase-like protein